MFGFGTILKYKINTKTNYHKWNVVTVTTQTRVINYNNKIFNGGNFLSMTNVLLSLLNTQNDYTQ